MFKQIVSTLNIPSLEAAEKNQSHISASQNEETFSFFTIVFSFKSIKCQHNTDRNACNLCLNVSETYL